MDKKLKLFLKKYEEEVNFELDNDLREICSTCKIYQPLYSKKKIAFASVLSSGLSIVLSLCIAIPLLISSNTSKFYEKSENNFLNKTLGMKNKKKLLSLQLEDTKMTVYIGTINDDYHLAFYSRRDKNHKISYNFSYFNQTRQFSELYSSFPIGNSNNFDLTISIINVSDILATASVFVSR